MQLRSTLTLQQAIQNELVKTQIQDKTTLQSLDEVNRYEKQDLSIESPRFHKL